MPIELGIWQLGDRMQPVSFEALDAEKKLEDAICSDLSLLEPQLLLIGRQVATNFGKFIDVLAMDGDGNLVVVELKRDKTPRDAVAQLLDYASWVQDLSYDEIVEIFATRHSGKEFDEAFADVFGGSPPQTLNESHRLVLVASELDPASERIIGYLAGNFGVPINTVFFRCFKASGAEFLARTWLIDPRTVDSTPTAAKGKKNQETWNKRDFYVSFGDGEANGAEFHRSWEDARRYGFISGGGGKWYSQTLSNLFPGARVFVNIPGFGFVGVGIVEEGSRPITDFAVEVDGKTTPILEAPLQSHGLDNFKDDPDLCEYLVRVRWLKTMPKDKGYWEKGMFAVQHTACKMRSSFTIERLVRHFGIDD